MSESREEEIIIIQDSDVEDMAHSNEDNSLDSTDDEKSKKKKILLFGSIAIILLLIIVVSLLLILKPSPKQEDNSMVFIEDKLNDKKVEHIQPSKLQNMIVKADYLYSNGSKKEALFLYEKIAQYSEAISLYNLGVAQLKDKQYKQAQNTFQKAIKNDEKRCVSAINAAVCSLHLNEEENFRYYIDLAYAYLPHEINSPLYSYYYTLINYYNHNYLEALSALKNPTLKDAYPAVQNNLKAKINALLENNYDAVEAMETNPQFNDDLSIALLYARIGDLTLASTHLKASIIKNIEPVKSQLALGLVNLKAGRIADATKEIKNVTDMFPQEVYKYYPINITLRESLFDAKKAQKIYRDKLKDSKTLNYQKIFYFSPYTIFNANQTIAHIQKGTANIYIDNLKSAKEYLHKSASLSSINFGIARSIEKALSFHIRDANEALQELAKIQPKHSILQYNLALTYAQLGNMIQANKHFLRSYHLDAKNYLSGVYAIMTSQLINKDSSKLRSILNDEINNEKSSEDKDLYLTLLHISQNNYLSSIEWLDNSYKERPLYLALDIMIALKLNRVQDAQASSDKLTHQLPHDILPHIMHIDAFFSDLKDTEYASKVLNYLKIQKFNYSDFYYGPYVTRYLYIQQNLITGKLYFLTQQLEQTLQKTTNNKLEIMNALAMVYLFDEEFEKSYVLYNSLIDDFKVRDAYTLFLAAVASTAANHHENAIALLELANLKNRSFPESRYALGLLYLEIKNNIGATIQFAHITQGNFISKYFDFSINTEELLFKKQHPED